MLWNDRYLRTLKYYVHNKSHPKGSIAEGYIAEECTTFFLRYFHNVETKHDNEERYLDYSLMIDMFSCNNSFHL